ncbi:uncharacterized protein LOC122265229 [Penaeus japonicus]|uniref:uncharacterized protein LOC122265229 n=1 Tax=Penaeus japonicus TaxID=27405 RepID=UPI001C712843|nr:uncharacterized protein LOC122265229 [Penaeus japonicus]
MVAGVTQDELKEALKKMKRDKALGPDNIPIQAWISLEEAGVGHLTSLFNKILAGDRIPDEWRKSTLMPIYKTKVDVQDCGSYQAYDRVPREELWHCMRESSIPEVYVRVVQDIYNECMTAVRSVVGTTEGYNMEVGLHQGSALSPFLFAVIMDKLTDGLRRAAPRSMMFADDTVLRSERGEVEKDLKRWRHALEKRGIKISSRKTEYPV